MSEQQTSLSGWTLEVLGGATLRRPDGSWVRMEAKTAALLAHLALAGAQSRRRLAELLWPDSREVTARSNLRQLLRRLRLATDEALLMQEDQELIRLDRGLAVDAVQLELHASAGRYAEAAKLQGALLHGFEYDGCEELADWVRAQRDHLDTVRVGACEQEAARLEGAGSVHLALEWNARLLEASPTHEEAFRRAMRLQAALGDRSAALRAYDRCRMVLQRELDVAPSAETTSLAKEIESGRSVRSPERRVKAAILPAATLRPPVLAGRARVWVELDAAWERRQTIFVFGEPGSGKTRLLTEFIASRPEEMLHIHGRPGDALVPYSTTTRVWRELLKRTPGVELPEWARRECARIMPELGETAPSAGPELDRLRLLEAMLEIGRRTSVGLAAIVNDDVQYADLASIGVSSYMVAQQMEDGSMPRFIASARTGELNPEMERAVQEMVHAGIAVTIELEPLTSQEVEEMVRGFEVSEAGKLAESLSRYTGGNPLFVVETLKSLLESGALSQGVPEQLPVPPRVETLLSGRLKRLRLPALQLLRVVAVARASFTLELASEVLEARLVDVAAHWQELLDAQFVREGWFTHDLLYEAVRREIPDPVRRWLHRRVAEAMAAHAAPTAYVAAHWLEAGEPQPRAAE